MSPLDRIANSLENIAQSLAQLVQRGDAFPNPAPKPADSPERRSVTPQGITLDFRDLGTAKPAPLSPGFAEVADYFADLGKRNPSGDFPPLDTMKGDLSDPIDPWGSGL